MTTMTKPSVDAERLQIVQRTARYVLSKATVGGARFNAMDIFPPELQGVKSGTPEYAWRWQLAWTWARAGYMHETLSGTGLNKHRTYTLLQLGREALERISTEPALASFYIKNRRTAGTEVTANRAAEFYRPQELVRLTASKGLRLVPTKSDPSSSSPSNDESENEETQGAASEEGDAPGEERGGTSGADQGALSDLRGVLGELQGLPVFFERITAVLERMNDRLVKVEGETRDQSDLLVEATRLMSVGGPKDGKDAPATRDEIATALAELTQSFLRDNPQNVGFTALLKKHEELHEKLASAQDAAFSEEAFSKIIGPTMREIVSREIKPALSQKIDERLAALETKVSADVRVAIAEEVSRVLAKDVAKAMTPVVREALAQEIGPGLTPVIEAIVRAQDKSEAHTKALAHASDKHVERTLGEKLGGAFEKLDVRIQAIGSGINAAAEKITETAAVMDQRATVHGAVITKIIEQRFEALASSIEERISALAPDALAMRELSEKLQSEVTGACEELKESLATVSADTQDLAERVDAVTDGFDKGHAEFKRQGAIIVDSFKQVSGAAQDVLDAANAVSREMIAFAKLRAMRDVPLEAVLDAGDEAVTRLAAAGEKVGSSSTSLGGGLIRPIANEDMRPIIFPAKADQKEAKP